MTHLADSPSPSASPRRKRSRRRGISLLELLIAIVVGSVLTTIAIAAIVAVQRVDRGLAERVALRRNFEDFSERARRDVHAANEARWDDQRRILRLQTAEGEWTEYRFRRERVERWRTTGDEGGATEDRLDGAYRTSRKHSWTVTPSESEAGQLIRIIATGEPAERSESASSPLYEIVAEVGRDRRLLHP
jgi:type II secretory pathway pseudopilin PulG